MFNVLIQEYEFVVDQTRGHTLEVNIDMTIAMNCNFLRGDVLDISGTSLGVSHNLKPVPVVFSTQGFEKLSQHTSDETPLNVHKLLKNKNKHHQRSFGKFDKGSQDGCRYAFLTIQVPHSNHPGIFI
jgi:endoplasmic reticulum-Golgi intermediate compartment protein 2